ncbi:MAG: hypothetical protein KAT58_12280 [candidate division Zixibacteria bacterium]|nr:hypothetical protein [candidate division Zixibacteria bacterium]
MKKIACISLMCAVILMMMPQAACGGLPQAPVPKVIKISPGDGDLVNIVVRWIHAPITVHESSVNRIKVKWIKWDGTSTDITIGQSNKVNYWGRSTHGHNVVEFKGINLPLDELRYSSFVFEFDGVESDPVPVSPFSDEPWVFMPYKDGDTQRVACVGKFNEYRHPEQGHFVLAVLKSGGGYQSLGSVHIKEKIFSAAEKAEKEDWLIAETTLEEASQYAGGRRIEFIVYSVSCMFLSPICKFIWADQKVLGTDVVNGEGGTYNVSVSNQPVDDIMPGYVQDFVESVNDKMTTTAHVNAMQEMNISLLAGEDGAFTYQDTPVEYQSGGTLLFNRKMSGDKILRFNYELESFNLGNSPEMDFCQMSFSGSKPFFCEGIVLPVSPDFIAMFTGHEPEPEPDESEVVAPFVPSAPSVPSGPGIVREEEVTVARPAQADADRLVYGGGWCSLMAETSADTGVIMIFLMLLFGVLTPLLFARSRKR